MTLVNSRSMKMSAREATHAEYAGDVLFKNTFEGELPAVEYPKINVSPQLGKRYPRLTVSQLYLSLSVIYLALGIAWAVLCVKHFKELL